MDIFSLKKYSSKSICPFCKKESLKETHISALTDYFACFDTCLAPLTVELLYRKKEPSRLGTVKVIRDNYKIFFSLDLNHADIIIKNGQDKNIILLDLNYFNIDSLMKDDYEDIIKSLIIFS